MNPHLHFGYVARAHGLRGELVVRTFDPASTVLDEVPRLLARRRDGGEAEYAITAVRDGPGGEVLVSLRGVGGREAAKALVGASLWAFREDLEAPGDGEVFQGDLVGLEAFADDGVRLGVVTSLFTATPVPNLVIEGDGREWMVPLVDDFVKEVDLAAGRVVVVPIDVEG